MSVQIGEPCTVYVFHRSPMSALELRIRGEYREMPGMRLKLEQAMRLWSLRAGTQRLLTALKNVIGYCYGNCEPRVVDFEQGTLVIDLVDARTKKVVRRGVVGTQHGGPKPADAVSAVRLRRRVGDHEWLRSGGRCLIGV